MPRSLRFASIGLLAMAAMALCTTAWSQPGPGRGGFGRGMGGMQSPAMMWGLLLRAPTVQKELNLTDDQKEKLKEYSDKAQAAMRELFAGMQDLSADERAAKMAENRKKLDGQAEEAKKTIEGILLPNQLDRLKEVALQRRGPQALADKEVQTSLALTDDQKDKIKTIGEDTMKKAQEIRAEGGDPQEARTKVQSLAKEAQEKVMELLTAEQKEKFEKMKGAKLEIPPGELQFGRPGGKRG
ncbi:MAG: Spy/CpxP family protein refolding chaperone [Thermoguttaceae bacterium]